MPDAGTESSTSTTTDAETAHPVRVDEVRVLEGPNLYFARPAIKVSLHLPGYLGLKRTEAEALARRLGMRSVRPGRRGTALRQRFVMRVIRTVTKRVGSEIGVGRLGVRVRAGQTVDDVVVAFPWAHRTRGQVAGEQIVAILDGLLDSARHPAGGHRGGRRRHPRGSRRTGSERHHPAGAGRLRHRHQRQDDDDPAHGAHVHDRRAAHRLELDGRHRRDG